MYGIQIDRLNLKVSTQKSVLKNTRRVPSYYQKPVQNRHSKLNQQNWHIFADISGLGTYISKLIFALKPWDWAGRFEYHEPHNLNDFFHLGVREILSHASFGSERTRLNTSSNMLCPGIMLLYLQALNSKLGDLQPFQPKLYIIYHVLLHPGSKPVFVYLDGCSAMYLHLKTRPSGQ